MPKNLLTKGLLVGLSAYATSIFTGCSHNRNINSVSIDDIVPGFASGDFDGNGFYDNAFADSERVYCYLTNEDGTKQYVLVRELNSPDLQDIGIPKLFSFPKTDGSGSYLVIWGKELNYFYDVSKEGAKLEYSIGRQSYSEIYKQMMISGAKFQ